MTDDTRHFGPPAADSEEAARRIAEIDPETTPDQASNATDDERSEISGLIEQPAKVMRIGTMIKQLLEEVRAAPLDERGRERLRAIHQSSIRELEQGLAPELRDELDRLTLPFGDDVPSEAELRIAQAQLVGWLEGLFHGIQTALVAQQMAAQQQLADIRRRALPAGMDGSDQGGAMIVGPGGQIIGRLGPDRPAADQPPGHGTGQYL
jgi:Protein of unknown function (DUF2587)